MRATASLLFAITATGVACSSSPEPETLECRAPRIHEKHDRSTGQLLWSRRELSIRLTASEEAPLLAQAPANMSTLQRCWFQMSNPPELILVDPRNDTEFHFVRQDNKWVYSRTLHSLDL